MKATFSGFTEYNPQRTAETLPLIKQGLVFIRDKSGNDWRELAKKLHRDKEAVHFIVVDKFNAIAAYSQDPQLLFPINCDVHVVDSVPVDKFGEHYFEWSFVNGKFVLHTELQKVEAGNRLAAEHDWVNTELASEEDEERIVLLRKFRAGITALNMSDAPHIDWPIRP